MGGVLFGGWVLGIGIVGVFGSKNFWLLSSCDWELACGGWCLGSGL